MGQAWSLLPPSVAELCGGADEGPITLHDAMQTTGLSLKNIETREGLLVRRKGACKKEGRKQEKELRG